MRTDDGYIIHQCLNGDPEAFGVLVDRYKESIYAYTYAKLQNWQIKASKRPDSSFIEDQNPAIIDKPSIESYHKNEMMESVHDALSSLSETYREVLTLYYFGGMDSNKIAEMLGVSPTAIRLRLSRARSQLREEIFNMMGVTFQQQKLRAGFTFRIVEAIKRIKINPISQTKTIPWRVSLVLGMIAVAIGLNPQLFTLELFNPGMDLSLIGESKVLDVGDIPVSIVKTAKTPLMSAQQGDSNGTNLDNMNVFSMALQAVDEWEKKADMPSGRGSTLGVINGKIYLIGGTPDALNSISDVEEYDPLADKWTKKTSMSKSRLGQASCVVNDKIYVFGGTLDRGFNWKAYSDVEEYDPLTDTWTPKSDMPAPLSYHYACEYNGKVYVFGGMADGVNDSSAMYIYDPKTDTWSQGKDAPRKRTSFSAGIVNGKIYAFGGGNPGYVVPVDEYDIAIDTWTTKTELKVLSANNSCVVINDKIYVIGGEKDNVPIDTMLIYDPIANTWEDAPSMKTPRGALAACAIDGVIYAIGGIAGFNNPISTIEVFDTGYSPVDQSAVNSQGKSPTTWGDKKK